MLVVQYELGNKLNRVGGGGFQGKQRREHLLGGHTCCMQGNSGAVFCYHLLPIAHCVIGRTQLGPLFNDLRVHAAV